LLSIHWRELDNNRIFFQSPFGLDPSQEGVTLLDYLSVIICGENNCVIFPSEIVSEWLAHGHSGPKQKYRYYENFHEGWHINGQGFSAVLVFP